MNKILASALMLLILSGCFGGASGVGNGAKPNPQDFLLTLDDLSEIAICIYYRLNDINGELPAALNASCNKYDFDGDDRITYSDFNHPVRNDETLRLRPAPDFNAAGPVNISDYVLFAICNNAIIDSTEIIPAFCVNADLNQDGVVDITDEVVFVSSIPIVPTPQSVAEDVNNDGEVDLKDLAAVAACLGRNVNDARYCESTNVDNSNTIVDKQDQDRVFNAAYSLKFQ